jgi:hypothetical protein
VGSADEDSNSEEMDMANSTAGVKAIRKPGAVGKRKGAHKDILARQRNNARRSENRRKKKIKQSEMKEAEARKSSEGSITSVLYDYGEISDDMISPCLSNEASPEGEGLYNEGHHSDGERHLDEDGLESEVIIEDASSSDEEDEEEGNDLMNNDFFEEEGHWLDEVEGDNFSSIAIRQGFTQGIKKSSVESGTHTEIGFYSLASALTLLICIVFAFCHRSNKSSTNSRTFGKGRSRGV